MTKKILTAFEFAIELKDNVLKVNLSKPEIKSLAKAIRYHIGIFSPKKRKFLENELIFINAYFGSIVLGKFIPPNKLHNSCHYTNEEIINSYVFLLSKELSDNFLFNEFYNKFKVQKGLLKSFNNTKQYNEDIKIFANTFYKIIFNKACPKDINRELTLRFNSYIEHIINTTKKMEQNIKNIEH